jgi:general secretion pathway protein D
MRRVIEQLDVRRPQVYVEAAIMEVALNESRDVGINAYAGLPTPTPGLGNAGLGILANEGGRQLFVDSAKLAASQQVLDSVNNASRADASTVTPLVDAASNLGSMLGLLAFRGPSFGKEQFGFPVPSIGATLQLLQTNSNVDILSTPHLMTTDNEKAEISVGQKVPVVRGIQTTAGAGALGFGGLQNVQAEDVKLKFTITPHVNASGEVRLEIEQEVSDLGGEVKIGNGLTQPIITSRTVKTTVVAGDQQTVVIGGLISDRKQDAESKVPFLGDLPIIGWLFKTWSADKAKTNLLIVLTPYIVRGNEDYHRIYEKKLAERKEFVEAYFTDSRSYDPYIDYDKKTGPLGLLVQEISTESQRLENGGPGVGGEVPVGVSFPNVKKPDPTAPPAPDHGARVLEDLSDDGGAPPPANVPPAPVTPTPLPPPPVIEGAPPAPAPGGG